MSGSADDGGDDAGGDGGDDAGGDGGDAPVPNRRRALAALFLVVFIDLLGFGILIPVIPLYAKAFGANEFVGSLLIATYSVFQFLAAPLLGRISDRRGRRPVLLVSLFGSVVAWTLFGVAGELGPVLGAANGLVVLFLARGLAGAMGGNISTAQAYIADITPPEDRAKGLGLLGAAFGLGFVFGPAISGLVSSPPALAVFRDVLPAFVPVSEFTMPSFTAAGITAANLALAFVVLPEPREKTAAIAAREGSRIRELYDAVTSPGLGVLIVSFFVASFAFSAFESQFIFLTNDRLGYDTAQNALLLTYYGVVIAVVQGGLIGPLTARFGEYRLALVGAAAQVVTLALVPFSIAWDFIPAVPVAVPFTDLGFTVPSAVVGLLAVSTPLAVGNALTNVSLNALVSRSASDDEQGGAFGLTQSAGSLARVFGPSLAGLLYVTVAYWTPFVVAGVLFVPVLLLLGFVARDAVRPSPTT